MSININPAKIGIVLLFAALVGVGCYFWGQNNGNATAAAGFNQQLDEKRRDAFYNGCTRAYTDLLPKDYSNYLKLTDAELQQHQANISRCTTLRDIANFD